MKNQLQALVCKILGEAQNSERTEKLLTCLTQNGVKNVDDLEYLDKECLEKLGILSNNEIEAVVNKITRMTLEDALEDIFKGSRNKERIQELRECLKNSGAERAEDLKYFDWESLKNTKILSEMDIEKIMYFVRKNFPEEYKEHKTKKNEADRLAREIDLIKQKNQSEVFLSKIREETTNSNFIPRNYPKQVIDTPSEEHTSSFRNIPREEFDLNRLLTLLINFLLVFWLIFGRFVKPLEHVIKFTVFLFIGFIFSMFDYIIVPVVIVLRRTILGT